MDFTAQSRRQPPKAWVDALEQGRADIKAGRTVDAEAFIRRLEREDAELFGSGSKPPRANASQSCSLRRGLPHTSKLCAVTT